MFKVKDVRNKILFILLCIVILRFGAQLPIPMIDTSAIKEWFAGNNSGGFSLLNAFTGGALENFSILSLSITPFITSSIILQLLGVAFPKLAEMQKEGGELGQAKFTRITKYLTIGVSAISALGVILTFSGKGLLQLTVYNAIVAVVALVGGTMFLIWLGDEITEKGIGNGISMVLMLSILSKIPADFTRLYYQFIAPAGFMMKIVAALVILLIVVFIIVMVIILDDAKKVIPVNYSTASGRRIRGAYAPVTNKLPIKVNIAGVIPVIFASTLLSMPPMIASLFGKQDGWVRIFSQNDWFNPLYWKFTVGYLIYAILVIAFAYYYTAITFNPVEMSNNLKNQGGTIPGIRPGRPTAEYLGKIIKRLIPIGAVWLLIIATIPMIFNGLLNASVSFGGTSIIIIVGVILETFNQIDTMMETRNYKGFL